MTRPQEPAEEPPRPRSIRSLPVLSPGVQSRYGIENLKVNMVGPVTETNPYGWALINRRKVQEGETIQGTRARLVQVEPYGIAIEITSTGERYFRAF